MTQVTPGVGEGVEMNDLRYTPDYLNARDTLAFYLSLIHISEPTRPY